MLDEYRARPRPVMNKRVLLINITRMGDLVQMGTLLQRLQHWKWPGAEVDLVVDQRFCSCGEAVTAPSTHRRVPIFIDW